MKVLSREKMEQRRMDAAKKLLEGVRPSCVAARFGVSRTSASRWHRAISRGGVESLRKHVAGGRPSRLTFEQKVEIGNWVDLGPGALGKSGDHWTAARLSQLIEERFGIHYHTDYVRKLVLRIPPPRAEQQRAGSQQCAGEPGGSSPSLTASRIAQRPSRFCQ
jgi:transposase